MRRALRSTRRQVPHERLGDYAAVWARFRDAVTGAGGHAWLFRSADRPDEYIEFIESRDLGRILALPAVAGALAALDEGFGAGIQESWEEAILP